MIFWSFSNQSKKFAENVFFVVVSKKHILLTFKFLIEVFVADTEYPYLFFPNIFFDKIRQNVYMMTK